MDRKGFIGIAQIRLSDLNLKTEVMGWYKLFHSNSLVGSDASDPRRNSENSLPDANYG